MWQRCSRPEQSEKIEISSSEMREAARLQRLFVWEPRNQAVSLPQFDIQAVDELPRFLNYLFVFAFHNDRWPRNVSATIDEIHAISLHDKAPANVVR